MKTSAECLVLADQMDERAGQSSDEAARKGYAALAVEWRRVAVLAVQQEHMEARMASSGDS